jgi:hypothetical protein
MATAWIFSESQDSNSESQNLNERYFNVATNNKIGMVCSMQYINISQMHYFQFCTLHWFSRSFTSNNFPPWRPGFESASCGICGRLSGTGAGFLRVLRFPLPIRIPPISPQSSSIIWGWYNTLNSGRSTKWTQSHPMIK